MRKAIAIVLLFISAAAHSDNTPKSILGAGSATCGRYNNDSNADKSFYVSWVLGYLAAENYRRPGDFLKATDSDAIEGAIRLYCYEHPLHTVARAGANVMYQLIEQSK